MYLPASYGIWLQKLQRHHPKSWLSVTRSLSLAEDPRKHNVKQTVKNFNEIPGPKSLFWFGTFHLYLLGIYSATQHRAAFKKYLKYGPIVREETTHRNFVVSIFDHNDMEHLFLSESSISQQQYPLAFKLLGKDLYHPEAFFHRKGENSLKPHKALQESFESSHSAGSYLPVIDNIIQEFVSSRLLQNEDDCLPDLLRLSLQLTSVVAFEKKIDCFASKDMKQDSRYSRLIDSVLATNRLASLFNQMPSRSAPLLGKLKEKMMPLEKVAGEIIKEKIRYLSESAVSTPLESYLTSPSMNFKDVVAMAVHLLLGGIETTAYTASFALYELAQNERVQHLLRLESRKILKSWKDPITAEALENAPYARAVLNEVFRMYPTLPGSRRILTQDIVLSRYHIPKGTTIITQNQAACRLSTNFVRPNSFLPERWIKGSPVQVWENPFLVLPFGLGSSSCKVRSLAEMQMLTFLLRIVHKNSISWSSKKKLDCNNLSSTINRPNTELKFTFSRIQ